MPRSKKLIRDLASLEYTRISYELKFLEFDDAWCENDKEVIRKYLLRNQSECQKVLVINSNTLSHEENL